MFDEPPVEQVYKDAQRELREGVDGQPPLLSPAEYDAARRTIRNAHYTDAEYVSAIWDALRDLGFSGGEVLEPGSGSGNFMGLIPDDLHGETHITGVELDPITAAIAQALYPDQDVRIESFADTQVPDGSFDAAVGNVPFANTLLVDPTHNPGRRHSMHNHFIIKALRLTRPGGLVAVLTSRYTMDAEDPKSRREMARYGDLVGAVRLPSGAHEAAAGTTVVTDLLIFRRREDGAEPAGMRFEESRRVVIDGREVAINELFLDQPEFVLGQFRAGSGNKDFLRVAGDKAAGPALREALAAIVRRAREEGLTQTDGRRPRPRFRTRAEARKMRGTITAHPDGTFTRVEIDEWGYPREVPYKVKPAEAPELRSLLRLRDTVLALRDAEARDDVAEMDRLRAELNRLYDEHVGQRREDGTWTGFGPVSRYTETRKKRKPSDAASEEDEATEETVIRRRPSQGGFRSDPFSAVVRVLEVFDPVTGDAKKTSIFRERSVAPRKPADRADSPADALAISLDTHGYVDLETVADLLGVDEPTAREMLGDLVFDEPGTDRLVPRAEYLSGNVRTKLDAARAATDIDERYRPNVEALERVLPPDVTPEDIYVQMGATWIDARYVQQFLREILRDPSITVTRSRSARWEIRGGDRKSAAATNEWGIEEYDAIKIADAVLNGRPITVTIEGSESSTADKTAAAEAKAAAMRERFEQWVWQDPARTRALVEAYNRAFNSLVLRRYDGSYLTFPGMSETFEPHPHVRDAVARIVQEPSVGLWHAVGAGKAQPLDALVLTPSGFIRMGDVVPGTIVVTPSGDHAAVLKVTPQGERDIYKLTFNDGTSVEADGDHLWTVQTSDQRARGGPWHVKTTNEIRDDLTRKNGATKWFVPNITPVDLDGGQERPLDPYLLGLLLGDGCLSAGNVRFTTADPELADAIRAALPDGAEAVQASGKQGRDWNITGKGQRPSVAQLSTSDSAELYRAHRAGVTVAALSRHCRLSYAAMRGLLQQHGRLRRRGPWNPVRDALRQLGLAGTNSHTKFVPDAYKLAPVAVRVAVLQGILDTDGTVSTKPTGDGRRGLVVTASKQLAGDIAWLAWSLGGRATVKETKKAYLGRKNSYWRVGISLPDDIAPFRLKRKAELVRPREHYRQYRRGIVAIEYVGRKPAQCILVDHPSHMYVTDNFTATHNSAEMIMGAMKLRQLGLVRKPAIVVPNHMLEQMTREFYRIFPQARVLAIGSEDLGDPDKKREVIAAAADPQWDAVIITHGAFKRIPVTVETEEAYMRSEIEPLRRAYARRRQEVIAEAQAAAEADGVTDADEVASRIRKAVSEDKTAKEIEAQIQAQEEAIKAKLTERVEVDEEAGTIRKVGISRDPGLTFEQTGIDYLFIDEAHLYKNLSTASQIEGMSLGGSQIASDLHMKLTYLRSRYDRVGTLATGTPIANSMREAYTMMRYLRPDLLQELGIETFDEFAANFGQIVARMEVSPTGKLRTKPRFARFVNVPEFLRGWLIAGDVMTSDDLLEVRDKDGNPVLRVPQLAEWTDPEGRTSRTPRLVVVPASPELKRKVESLARRAENLPRVPEKGGDNMLRITGEGRAAALDLRLVGMDTDQPQKLDIAADEIARIHEQHKDRVYVDQDGNPIGQPGALQLVFCDLGTPSGRKKRKKGEEGDEFGEGAGATAEFDAYTALREKLVERGIPREKIAFIHDAKTDQEKAELFAAARDGRIAVLIGSTQKMGVGTNIQDRAVALHHLDAPWRPADIEQREGRIVRHGNANPEVQILRYVTEGSFDAYIWQAITTKGTYINQVMRGRLDVREMDDVGEFVLSATQAVALGTGNPYLIEHADALAEVTRLERKRRNHDAEQRSLARIIEMAEADVRRADQHIAAIDAALPKRVDTRGARFAMTVGDVEFAGPTDRPDAQNALRDALRRVVTRGQAGDVGEFGGFTLRAHPSEYAGAVEIEFVGLPGRVFVGRDAFGGDTIGKLQRALENLETVRGQLVARRERALDEIEHSQGRLGVPFPDEQALIEARERFEAIDRKLKEELEKRGQSAESLDPEVQAAARRAQERADLEAHLAEGGGFTSIGQLTAYLEGGDERVAETVGQLRRAEGAKWGVLSSGGQFVIVKGSGSSDDKFRVLVPRTLQSLGEISRFRTQRDAKEFAAELESAGVPWNTGVDLKTWRDPKTGRSALEIAAAIRASRYGWDPSGSFRHIASKLEVKRRVPERLHEALGTKSHEPLGDLARLGTGTYPDERESVIREQILKLLESAPEDNLELAEQIRTWGLEGEGKDTGYAGRSIAFDIATALERDHQRRNPGPLDDIRRDVFGDGVSFFVGRRLSDEEEQKARRILNRAERSGDFASGVAELRRWADEVEASAEKERYAYEVSRILEKAGQIRTIADRLERLDSLADRQARATEWDDLYRVNDGYRKVRNDGAARLVEQARFAFVNGKQDEAIDLLRRVRRDFGTFGGLIDAMIALVEGKPQPAESEMAGAGARSAPPGYIRVADLPDFLRSLGVLPIPGVDPHAVRLLLSAFERDAMSTASEPSLLGEQYGMDDDEDEEEELDDDPDNDDWLNSLTEEDWLSQLDEHERAELVGHVRADLKPGDGRAEHLHRYWVAGKGLKRWAAKKRPWRTLRRLLTRYTKNPEMAKRLATKYVHEVFGLYPGHDAYRVMHGGKPRGKRIGPG